MISLKKSFVYKDLCYLMSLWSVKLPLAIAREKRFDPFYYHDYQNMRELDESIDGIHVDLDKLMKDWESLHEELEKSSKQTNIKV